MCSIKDNGKGTKFSWLGFDRLLRKVKKEPSEQNQQQQVQKQKFVFTYKNEFAYYCIHYNKRINWT